MPEKTKCCSVATKSPHSIDNNTIEARSPMTRDTEVSKLVGEVRPTKSSKELSHAAHTTHTVTNTGTGTMDNHSRGEHGSTNNGNSVGVSHIDVWHTHGSESYKMTG